MGEPWQVGLEVALLALKHEHVGEGRHRQGMRTLSYARYRGGCRHVMRMHEHGC